MSQKERKAQGNGLITENEGSFYQRSNKKLRENVNKDDDDNDSEFSRKNWGKNEFRNR